MATKTIKKSTPKPVAEVEAEVSEVVETKEEKVVETKKEKKTFEPTDTVECESITAGALIMVGAKSGSVYKWNDIGDVTEVEYRDLVAAVRSASDYINKPYFLIKDEDFLADFPKVVEVYNSLYSSRDLKDILRNSTVGELAKKIDALPEGAKKTIQHLASTMIANGQLDSVNKIKVLDEYFGTKLMLLTGLYEN